MKLITKELEKRFAEIGHQEKEIDPIVVARFIDTTELFEFFATSYLPEVDTYYGFVDSPSLDQDGVGWQHFNLTQILEKSEYDLEIIRDTAFSEQRISKLLGEIPYEYHYKPLEEKELEQIKLQREKELKSLREQTQELDDDLER